jgi:hypothetical protein
MTVAKPTSLPLKAFLQQPETEPPSEYINGEIIQKPMPEARYSRLQAKSLHPGAAPPAAAGFIPILRNWATDGC